MHIAVSRSANVCASNMTDYFVAVIAPDNYPHWPVFTDTAWALAASLRDLGHSATASWISTNKAHPSGKWIVFGANILGSNLAGTIKIPADAILFNLEQIDGPWMKGPYLHLLRQHEVWDYSERGVEGLRSAGINAKLCRIGYHPCLTRIEPTADESIDVLFYGSNTERRVNIIRALCDEGINVQTLFGCYGAPRDQWISKAKLILNLHSWNNSPLEIVRLQLLFSNRKCVVTETCAPDDPEWNAYRGCMAEIDTTRPDEAAFTIKMLLADQETRFRIGQLGYEAFSHRLQKDYLPL